MMRRSRQCLALVAMLAGSQAVADCGDSTPAPASTDASWVRTETPLFVFDKKGRLFRAGFDRRLWTLVSDHALRGQAVVEVTDGGRWIMYGEESLTTIPHPRTWLFDTRTSQDKALGSDDRFFLSPDGRHLLRYVRGGLELRDLETQAARVVPVPPSEDYGALDWSVDGELLVWVGNDPRRTWILDPAQDRFVPIEGGLEPGVGTYYLRGGKRIALDMDPMAPSDLMLMESISPDGAATAKVGEGYKLEVRMGSQPPRTVATGRFDDCEGPMIGVRGWVDGHKYLVYFDESVEYIHDVATGRTARLFDEAADVDAFAWPGWTHREPRGSGKPAPGSATRE